MGRWTHTLKINDTDMTFHNPGDGGVPESTDVAGGGGATPTTLTLLQIDSHVQNLHADAQGDFQSWQICFVKLLYIRCPWGIGEHDHLRHVTKIGM